MEAALMLLGATGLASVIGWGLSRITRPAVAFVLAAIGLLAGVTLIFLGRHSQGWDALGYAIMAFFMAAPVTLGFAVGGLIETFRRVRKRSPR